MTAQDTHRSSAEPKLSFIHSTRLHVVLYSMLLVATPFVMLQAFLQQALGELSASKMTVLGYEVPIVPIVALVVLISLLVAIRRHLTWLRILAGVVALVMIAVAQQIADYYFDHNFYELQQNWHYIAYGIFTFMLYRDLNPRGYTMSRIMLIAFVLAMLYSSFDEAFQMRMANRIYDIGDTAKDVWGVCTGLIVLYMIRSTPRELRADWKKVRWRRIADYFRHAPSVCILLIVFGLIFVSVSSLLTERIYVGHVLAITFAAFILFFLLFHISQFKWGAAGLTILFAVVLVGQSYFFIKYRSENIIHNRYGLTIYKGIPILFFDGLVLPNGSFRLVDKKHHFNHRDQRFLLKQGTDIILVGSGDKGKGGHGFPEYRVSQFIFNPFIERGSQVIVLTTPEACRVFNRLKREGKSVLFVLHNTC